MSNDDPPPLEFKASVIICTHNPYRDYLDRTLDALKNQTLPTRHWELILVDNRSTPAVLGKYKLDWHPHARCVRQEELGLSHARLHGIACSTAPLLIFVDDDNILEASYLETCVRISKQWPILGAWSGNSLPEFEQSPPTWTKPCWYLLALRQVDRATWSNSLKNCSEVMPFGAGMSVRREIAEHYSRLATSEPLRLRLGRKGGSLASNEDCDLCITGLHLGFGLGLFPQLTLRHLIKSARLEKSYLLNLSEANGYSLGILRKLHPEAFAPLAANFMEKAKIIYRSLKMSGLERSSYLARQRGIAKAIKDGFY